MMKKSFSVYSLNVQVKPEIRFLIKAEAIVAFSGHFINCPYLWTIHRCMTPESAGTDVQTPNLQGLHQCR